MKKFILGLCLSLPILSHAAPKWELANVFITNKDKGEISKIYVEADSSGKCNSIKTSHNITGRIPSQCLSGAII